MTIAPRQSWGIPGGLPSDGVIVGSDAEARAVIEHSRRGGIPPPVVGLTGGDLCRTLGGTGDLTRLRTAQAITFPVDVGAVLADGRLYWFVSHLVARNRSWTRAVVAMNAQWLGDWDLAPRGHPNDGLLDISRARLRLADLLKVRRRLPHGTHLPHPRIGVERSAAVQIRLDAPLPLWLDGVRVGSARDLSIRAEPDALRVVV